MHARKFLEDCRQVPRGIWWALAALGVWLLTLIYYVVRFYGLR